MENEKLRFTVNPLDDDDDLRPAYQGAYDDREKAHALDWLQSGDTVLPEITVTPDERPRVDAEFSGAAAAGDPATENSDDDGLTVGGVASAVGRGVAAVGTDVARGMTEAVPQAFGGFVDALGEVDQFLQSVLPIGGMALFDKEGNFDPSFISNEEMQAIEQAGDTLFDMVAPDDADSVTGGVVRAASQFLTGFLPGVGVARAAGLGGLAASFAGGAIADAVVFDPHEDRLSTFLNEVPALEAIVPDYLAATGPENQTEWEGRLKNAIEGAGLGALAEGLIKSFKYYKAQRQLAPVEEAPGAQGSAARDQQRAAAEAEIANDVTDAELLPLGDASPDAPLLIEARPDETLSTSIARLREADTRMQRYTERGEAMARVREIVDAKVARDAEAGRGVPTGDTAREPVDDLLDQLRGNKVGPKLPARPVATIVRGLGGVDPSSSLAGDLRSRGITPRSFPGLFRKGGLDSLDNIPASEHALFVDRSGPDGYIPEQSFIDGLEEELKGNPWRTADEQALIDDMIAPLEDLEEHLSRLGIRYEEMSNDAVKARLRAIEEEQAAEDAYFQSIATRTDEGQARTYAELADEQREIWSTEQIAEARAGGVSEEEIARHSPPKVYVNFARINTADDVKALIQTMADADAAHITDKTRGVVSNQQTIKESSKEYKDLNDLIGRAPGPMSAAQAVAARNVMASSAEQLMQLAKIAAAPNAGKVDLYNFRRAASVHAAIQAEVIGARTETARALQSWAIPSRADRTRTDAIQELLATNQGGDLQKLAKSISGLTDEAAINQIARETVKMKTVDAVYSVWVNGLLSGYKTHLVNVMSNAAVSLYAIPERYAAELGSNVFGRGDIARGETQAMAYGMIEGIRDGVRLMVAGPKAAGVEDLGQLWEQFGKTEARPNPISGAAFELDPNTAGYRGLDLMGQFISLPGTLLERGDLFFKSVNYRMELHALAYREAKLMGLEGEEFAAKIADTLLNPPTHLHEQANKMALVNTFTNPLGQTGQQVQRAISGSPLRWAIPFVRTPTNIMKYTFARTPLAYTMASVKADLAAGGARAAQAHARVGMSTMAMMTFAGLAIDGQISGGGPLDPKLKAAKRADGWQPYSIKMGDKWVAYNRLDPLGMMIGIAADLAEITTSPKGEADDSMIVAAAVTAFAQNMASKTYAQGAFELAAALDPRNPAGDPAKFMERTAGGLVPYSSFLRQTAQAMDPVMRETRDRVIRDDGSEDKIASYLNGLVNNFKRGLPGLSDNLPPVRDLFGEPMTFESGLGTAWDMIMPISVRNAKNDPVLSAIVDNEVKVSRISDSVRSIKLTADQYDRLQVLAGPMTHERLTRLVSSSAFKRLSDGPDGMKAQMIRRAVGQSHDLARAQFMAKDPEFRDKYQGKVRATGNRLLGAQ